MEFNEYNFGFCQKARKIEICLDTYEFNKLGLFSCIDLIFFKVIRYMARVERGKHVKYEKKTLRLLNNMPKVMIQNEYEREAC